MVTAIATNNHPWDTGRKLNPHKMFRRHPGRLLNVLRTFSLRYMSKSRTLRDNAVYKSSFNNGSHKH